MNTNNTEISKLNNEIQQLLLHYQNIVLFRKGQLTIKSLVPIIESMFGGKISCNSCPSSVKKAASDYEKVVFSKLHKLDRTVMVQPNKMYTDKTRFVNGMYEELVTCSFDIFPTLLEYFIKDYKQNRLKIDATMYQEIYDELIRFNTSKANYFDSDEYKAFLERLNPVNVIAPLVEETSQESSAECLKTEIKLDESYNKDKYSKKKVNLEEAIILRNEGKTYDEIAITFGVTRQAIYKLFKQYSKNVEE